MKASGQGDLPVIDVGCLWGDGTEESLIKVGASPSGAFVMAIRLALTMLIAAVSSSAPTYAQEITGNWYGVIKNYSNGEDRRALTISIAGNTPSCTWGEVGKETGKQVKCTLLSANRLALTTAANSAVELELKGNTLDGSFTLKSGQGFRISMGRNSDILAASSSNTPNNILPWRLCNGRFESISRNYYDFNGAYGSFRLVPVAADSARISIKRSSRDFYDRFKALKQSDYGGTGDLIILMRDGDSISLSARTGYMKMRLTPTRPGFYSLRGTYTGHGDFVGELECQ